MNKVKKFLLSPKTTLVFFGLSIVLLAFSSIGGARAALTYYSDTYSSRVQMYDIGVSLMENGQRISWRDYNSAADGTWSEQSGALLGNMLVGEKFKPGKSYKEELSVHNSGTINQYVRVSIHKYWLDASGKKLQGLSPDLIKLNLLCDATGHDNGWIYDKDAKTAERTVLYYNKVLYAEGSGAGGASTTPLFADTFMVDGAVATKVKQSSSTKDGYTTITTTYEYDGVQFRVEAKVDAVQEHNAEDAILSAWGRKVSVNNGILSLE